MTAAHKERRALLAAAALLAFGVSAAGVAAQTPRGPGVNWDYAQIAEGYTSASRGGSVEGAVRMFSAPDMADVCARAGTVMSLRAAARIAGRVGEPIPYTKLKVDALDVHRVLVPKVPIAIESEVGSEVLDTRQDHIGADSVTPIQAGTVRLRIRTICDAPGGEAFITVRVDR